MLPGVWYWQVIEEFIMGPQKAHRKMHITKKSIDFNFFARTYLFIPFSINFLKFSPLYKIGFFS